VCEIANKPHKIHDCFRAWIVKVFPLMYCRKSKQTSQHTTTSTCIILNSRWLSETPGSTNKNGIWYHLTPYVEFRFSTNKQAIAVQMAPAGSVKVKRCLYRLCWLALFERSLKNKRAVLVTGGTWNRSVQPRGFNH